MPRTRTRWRRLAAITAGALLGLTIAAAPSPASAEETPWLSAGFGLSGIAIGLGPGSPGKVGMLSLSVYRDVPVRDIKVRIGGAPNRKLIVTPPGIEHGCTIDDLGTVCSHPEIKPGDLVELPYTVRVAEGARVGDQETVTFEITAANLPHKEIVATPVTIGDSAPDLTVENIDLKDVAPGAVAAVNPTVYNVGDTATTGIALVFHGGDIRDRYLKYIDEFANCAIENAFPVCVFPGTIMEPGHRYQLAEPLRFTVSERTPWPLGVTASFAVWPEDSSEAAKARKAVATKRGGKQLALVDRGPAPRAVTDPDPMDNGGRLHIQTTRNPADLSVQPVTVTGNVGEVVAVTFSMKNNGPADTASRADAGPGMLHVTAPTGTVFSKVDESDCAPYINGKVDWSKHGQGGYRSYDCHVRGRVEAGEAESFPLTLTIKSRSVGSDGSIETRAGTVPDDNPKNNKAALVVKVQGGGTPTGTPSAPGGGGGSDDGGPLPTTGASLPTYGAVAALLIGVGGVLYLVARRRRTATAVATAGQDD